MKDMKYILVTGGVISGIGKGVVASSIGVLLKHCGVEVTTIKIDPYINIGWKKTNQCLVNSALSDCRRGHILSLRARRSVRAG